jgi:hypothetical protein
MYSTKTMCQINYLMTCKYKVIKRNMCWCNWEKLLEENFVTSSLMFCAVLRKVVCDWRWILHVLDLTEIHLMALVLRPNWKRTLESGYKCIFLRSCRSIMGLLELCSWNFGFHKMRGVCYLRIFWKMSQIPCS